MKFENLVFDYLLEAVKDKQRFNIIFTKWKSEDPNLSEELAEFLFNEHLKRVNNLKVTNPNVITFLNRFDGDVVRYNKFAPNVNRENVLDIEKALNRLENFSLEQIKFLISEFVVVPGQEQEIITRIAAPDEDPTPKIVDQSKNLWYSKGPNLIIDEGDFRVYAIYDRQTSIDFGYYNGYISQQEPYKSQPHHSQWCTTRHRVGSNLYSGYRDRRTFYFVIDETKNPDVEPNVQISQYYLSALQHATDTGRGTNYKITTILNSGSDRDIKEEEIYTIYPKMRGHLNKIVRKEYDQKAETNQDTDVINLMTEMPGEFEYKRRSQTEKKIYIDRGKPLRKKESWLSTPKDLRRTYFDLTDNDQFPILERFSNEIIITILNDKDDKTSFLRRLKILNVNLSDILAKVFFNDYEVIAENIKNDNIKLVQSKKTKKYGLCNTETFEFLNFNGITYSSEYQKSIPKIMTDDNDNDYIVIAYSKSSTPDDKTFYSVFESNFVNKSKIPSYFLSKRSWDKLISDNKLIDDKAIVTNIETDLDVDTDIKEIDI
jgi:hypothetical protein